MYMRLFPPTFEFLIKVYITPGLPNTQISGYCIVTVLRGILGQGVEHEENIARSLGQLRECDVSHQHPWL